ncbi:MAG: hypothetical protein AB8B99_18920 [Phormidesmis sp.]
MEPILSPIAYFLHQLQQQAIVWIYMLSWVAFMVFIHQPPRRMRTYTQKQKRRNLVIAALVWIGILLALRLVPTSS